MSGILSVQVTGDAPRKASSIEILILLLIEGEKYSTTQSVTALTPKEIIGRLDNH
jgi:hypothetical protein